jgi:hypothetical protein
MVVEIGGPPTANFCLCNYALNLAMSTEDTSPKTMNITPTMGTVPVIRASI